MAYPFGVLDWVLLVPGSNRIAPTIVHQGLQLRL